MIQAQIQECNKKTFISLFGFFLAPFFCINFAFAEVVDQAPPAFVSVQTGNLDSARVESHQSDALVHVDIAEKPIKEPALIANSKVYKKANLASSVEMDLRQLWMELKLNNPQLVALRESYLAAKATVPQIAAPANPQVGLVW